jgi:two-component system chemotaxis response regulator CheY
MGKTILTVDDSSTMRQMIGFTLKEAGFAILEAGDGLEALERARGQKLDLVITDVNMPDVNGLELVAFLKGSEALRAIPLIVVSSEGSEKDCERGLSLPANAYLTKPFDPEKLVGVVRELLARRRGEQGA